MTAPEAPAPHVEATAPWTEVPGGVLDGGELVILAIKPSLWRVLFDSASWLVTCLSIPAVLIWLDAPLPGLSLGMTAQLFLLIAACRLAVAFMRWVPTWHLLTNRRIIDVRGVRVPRVDACSLLEVRNTHCGATPTERSVKLGTITFITESADHDPRRWRSIANAEEVHRHIRRAIEQAIDNHQS